MESAPKSAASKVNPWVWAALLAALIGAVFWPVLTFDFVRWDDDINVTQNPMLTAPWSWSLAGQFFDSSTALRFEPVHWLILRIVAGWFGFNPIAWHALSLVGHGVAGVLAFVVLRRVFGLMSGMRNCTAVDAWAWLGAALWALHPLRAETVAWVTASTYPLVAVFLLGSFLCYLEAHRNPERAPARRPLALAWLFAVAAYGSYPIGAAYGLWLMVADRWLLGIAPARPMALGDRRTRDWWGKHACFLAPAAIAVVLTVWNRLTAPGIFGEAPSLAAVDIGSRGLMALAVLAYLPLRFLWPVNLTPNVPPLPGGVANHWPVIALALAAMGLLWFAWRRRANHGLALVVFGTAAISVPCLGLTERPNWPVDRYSYLVNLVMVGGCVGGIGAWTMGEQRRRTAIGAALATGLLVAGAFASRTQIMIWRDTDALFAHMEQSPGFADNPTQAGYVYFLWGRDAAIAGQPERAAELFARAQEVYVAAIKVAVGRADYDEALRLAGHLEGRFGLTPVMRREKGAWLLRVGRRDEARHELREAQRELPDDARVRQLIDEAQGPTKSIAP